jgi:hypothetical protein
MEHFQITVDINHLDLFLNSIESGNYLNSFTESSSELIDLINLKAVGLEVNFVIAFTIAIGWISAI